MDFGILCCGREQPWQGQDLSFAHCSCCGFSGDVAGVSAAGGVLGEKRQAARPSGPGSSGDWIFRGETPFPCTVRHLTLYDFYMEIAAPN